MVYSLLVRRTDLFAMSVWRDYIGNGVKERDRINE